MPDPIKDLYNSVKSNGLFVDESDFRSQLAKSPKEVYSTVSDLFVDYNDFENVLGFKKKVGGTVSQTLPSQSQSILAQVPEKFPLGVPGQVPYNHSDEVFKARQKVQSTLEGSDDIYGRVVREDRVNLFEQQQRSTPTMDGFVNPAAQKVKRDLLTIIPVTQEDITTKKQEVIQNPVASKEILRRAAKKDPEIAKSAYLVDSEDRVTKDPLRINTVVDNANKIASGELTYDIKSGRLQKPEGLLISTFRGIKERNRQIDDYDFLTKTLNDNAIISQLEADMKDYDPDKPMPVPEGAAAGFGQMLGMEGIAMAKGAGSAILTSMIPGAQPAAPFVAAFAASPEYYKRGYSTGLRQAYYEQRQKGVPEMEALSVARKQAESEANLSAAEGIASGFVGARIGLKPTELKLGGGFKNAVSNVVSSTANFAKENLPEGLADASVAGGLQIAKNIEAINNGLDRNVFDGVQENVAGELGFTIGLGVLTKAGKLAINPKSLNTIVTGIAQQPKEVVDAKLGEMVVNGMATPKEVVEAGKKIEEARALNSQIPQEITDEESRAEIAQRIKIREDLKKQLSTANEVFHDDIKQKIKDVDQDIINIVNTQRNAINESQIQVTGTESNISQPQGIVQGQPEVGQGEGIQGQATQPQANVSDSNIGGQGQVTGQELSNIERLTPEQIQVSNDATGFADQMQTAQSSLGRMGMSVSPYVQEDYDQIASEGGKFLRAADNKVLSLLKPNGEMVSLVKDASVKAKGAAQAMISRMKDMGGLFMDNYDIYLTPIYEKAGYKVVARVPFNEEFAPEGWNAEDSPLKNKPDVVFMVRNDIAPEQAQSFTDYEEAQNYTQGLVDQAVKDGVAKLPTQITKIDQALGQAIHKATQSLEKSGIKIQVVDAATDTESAKAARGNQGLFVSQDGTVIIDKSKLANEIEAGLVVWHEASHPVMNIIRNTNKPLYDAVVRGLKNAAKTNDGVFDALDWAKSQPQYDNVDTQNDEAIVETIGRINAGLIDINSLETGLRQKLIDFVNSIAKFFGIDPILNDTDLAAFKKTVGQVADALKTGRDIGEVVGQENVMEYGAPIGVPVQPKVADKYGPVVKHDGGSYKLSFVKPSDIIDIKSLVKDIADKGQKVWFWTADQLGRGMYYDNVIEGEHYLDAGPSFALDPKNREKSVIWATGKGEKWVNDKIANSDYIFIISGSPQKSKLFNKRVAEITFNRIKKALGEEGSWDKFKSEVLGVSKIGKINEILNKYNSFEELLASPDRKELLIQIDAQKEKKGTPLKGLLEKYGAFIDYNDLRDGFFKDNDFNLNDVMLVLKPTGYGGKSAHSTYENDILGEVVGVPDRKVNAYDLMPDDFKAKYAPDMSRTEQSQAVAPYGAGVRDVQASVGNRDIINGFYSPIEDRINTFKQPKASVQKWKEIVGMKSDEAVFSGMADWLGGMKPDRQLSKEEVLKFMKDNRIEIKEVVKGKGGKMSQKQMDDVYNGVREQLANMDMIDDVDGVRNNPLDVWYNDPTDDNYDTLGDFLDERGIDLNFIADADNDGTKYSQYQLPGGEDYKEILITLQKNPDPKYRVFDESRFEVKTTKDNQFTGQRDVELYYDGDLVGQRYGTRVSDEELIDDAKKRFLTQDEQDAKKASIMFKSSHFDEPNIITHLRMNTRKDADGKKVLFLEEVQSDWGQKGKREGFKNSEYESKLKELQDNLAKATQEFESIENELDRQYEIKKKEGESRSQLRERDKDFNSIARRYAPAEQRQLEARNAFDLFQVKNRDEVPNAPYVTNTNAWVKLGLKVALKEAVKQGADRIAWTTGEQQNERYDLSKQVDEVGFTYIPSKNEYRVVAGKGREPIFNQQLKEGDLESTFGKDVAEKIISNKDSAVSSMKFLRGQDLKVGGKGMKAFYGDANNTGIVGNVAKALVKELTGREGQIVPSKISSPRNQDVIDRYNRARQYGNIPEALAKEYEQAQGLNSEQPAIDITPELTQSVQKGMPQFSVGGRSEEDLRAPGAGKERNRALSTKFGDLDPETQAKIDDDAVTYFQRPNKQTAKAVEEFIDGQNIVDMADYVLSNPDIPEVSKVWMAAEVAKRMNAEIAAATDQDLKDALTDKQAAIYNEFAKKATTLGQAVQAFIAFKQDPNAVEFFLPKVLRQLKKAGVDNVTDIQRAEIVNLLKDVNSAADGLPKDKAIIKLSHYLASIAPMKPIDVLQALWYAKILSGVTTQATNFFANVFNTAFELPAVGLRIALKTGNPMAVVAGIKGFGSGVFKGAVAAADIVKSGVRSKEIDKYFSESPLEYFTWSKWLGEKGKVLDNIPPLNFGAWKYVGRLLSATDALFSTANQEAIANMLAYAEASGAPGDNNFKKAQTILGNSKQNIADAKAQAIAEGFDPKTLQGRRRVIEIVAQKRGEKITTEADAIGKRITLNYTPEGWTKPLYDAVVGLQKSVPAIKMVIPFARIVANLTENALNYTPAGLAKAVTGARDPFSGMKNKLTADERADLFAKFAIGMGALAVAATKMGEDDDDWFEITAGGSPDVQKRYELQKGGWRPYTITLKDGSKISYKDWPIAGVLAGLGHIRDAKKYSFDDSTQMGLYAYGFFLNFYDKSLLSGLQDFFGLFNVSAGRGKYAPESKASERLEKYAAQQVKSVALSNLAQQTGRLYSELVTGNPQRDAKTFSEILYKDIPVMNDGIRPIIDVFGEPVKYNTTERLKPIYSTESEKVIKWLNENKLFVGVPQKKNIINADGSERPMTDQEYYEYRKLAGQKSKDWINKLISGIENENIDISDAFFQSSIDAARDLAYIEVLTKYGFK